MTRLCTGSHTLLRVLPLAFLLAASSACNRRVSDNDASTYRTNPALQSLVDGPGLRALVEGPRMTQRERSRVIDQVRRFYGREHYQLIWIDDNHPSTRYHTLLKILDHAEDNGLSAELYPRPLAGGSIGKVTVPAAQAAEFDVRASVSLFRYVLDLTGGRLDPHAFEPQWTLKPEKPDLVDILTNAVERDELEAVVQQLKPQESQYAELQKALVRYRKIRSTGGWPEIPVTTRLKPGNQSTIVPTLRDRLRAEGDLGVPKGTDHDQGGQSLLVDPSMVDALKRFQERHRIQPSGNLDADTVAAMNVPVGERVRSIELGLERWRWLPDRLPDRYLMVNVPDYRLDAVEKGEAVMSMRVVVGAPDKKTPIFADRMEYVIFSPYWNVPPDIARSETLPHASRDPDYLARNNMEAVDRSGQVIDAASIDWSGDTTGIRIRQRPGSDNALGGVKFVFPNNFNVYLHDTNAGRLFDRMERGLSHGCVRVEEPAKLAQYVLRDQPEWTPEAIMAAMQAGEEKRVNLRSALPVYILYMTVWVHDGGVRFLKDIYGHDAAQEAGLWTDSN